MAVRFDLAADRLLRTTDLLDYNAAYTWMAWLYISVDANVQVQAIGLNTNTNTSVDSIGFDATGTLIRLRVQNAGVGSNQTGSNLTAGTWYHVAMVRESTTSLKLYVNGVLDITHTQSVVGRGAATRMEIGANASTDAQPFNGRVYAIKAWSTTLDVAAVANEIYTVLPRQRTNLYGFWPCFLGASERLLDYSGNGRNWTESGTLTDEDAPPVSWGARSSFRIFVTTGTIYNQAIDATAGNAFTLIKSAGKIIAIANTPVFTKTALINKTLSYTAPDATTFIKQTGKNIVATNSASVLIARAITFIKTITASVGSAATFVKSIGKHVNVTIGNIVTFVKGIGKTIVSTANSAVTQIRNVAKSIATMVNSTAVFSKVVGKIVSFSSGTTSVITTAVTFLKTITANVGNIFTVLKNVQKPITITSSPAVTQVKQVGKIITVAISNAISIATQFIAGGGTLFFQTISASVGNVVDIKKSVGKIISIATTNTITFVKHINTSIVISTTNVVAIIKNVAKNITISSATTTIISTAKTILHVINASIANNISYVVNVGKSLSVTASQTITIPRAIFKTITIAVITNAQILKGLFQTINATISSVVTLSMQAIFGIIQTFYRDTATIALSIKDNASSALSTIHTKILELRGSDDAEL